MEALGGTSPVISAITLLHEKETVPSAQDFHEKLAEVTANLTTIPYQLAEKLLELEAILMSRLNHFVKGENLTNRKLSLIESYLNKLNNLYIKSGLALSRSFNQLSRVVTEQRELLDLMVMAEDPTLITPELYFVYSCNAILESILPPMEFPDDCFRPLLQSMLEATESFNPSLTEFEECERLILIESFQDLFFRKLSSIFEKAAIASFPPSIEEFKAKVISDLNGPITQLPSEILFLESCRVVFFAHIPKEGLPFPLVTIPYISFEILKYHINNGAKPSEIALGKRIPLLKELLTQISNYDLFAMRRIGFVRKFLMELDALYQFFHYPTPISLLELGNDIFIKSGIVPFPDIRSSYYSEMHITDCFDVIKDLIAPHQFHNIKTNTYTPRKMPDIFDPEFQRKVMLFISDIKKGLENLKIGLALMKPIEQTILLKILERLVKERLTIIYPLLTKIELNEPIGDFKLTIIHESRRLKLEAKANILAIELLEIAIPIFFSSGV